MGKEGRTTDGKRREAPEENLYLRLIAAVRNVFDSKDDVLSVCINAILKTNYIDVLDIVHDAFLDHTSRGRMSYNQSRNINAARYGLEYNPEVPLRAAVRAFLTKYVSEYQLPLENVSERPNNRIPVRSDGDRVFYFNEMANLMAGKVSESIIWKVLCNYTYCKMLSDGIIDKNIYNIALDDIKKVIVVSDYLYSMNNQ